MMVGWGRYLHLSLSLSLSCVFECKGKSSRMHERRGTRWVCLQWGGKLPPREVSSVTSTTSYVSQLLISPSTKKNFLLKAISSSDFFFSFFLTSPIHRHSFSQAPKHPEARLFSFLPFFFLPRVILFFHPRSFVLRLPQAVCH